MKNNKDSSSEILGKFDFNEKKNEWACVDKIVKNIDNLAQIDEQQTLVLFGVGMYGEFALQYFKKCGIAIQYYCDNDVNKQGKIYDGIRVISPNELSGINNSFVLITARHCVREISWQLSELNIKHISFDAYFVSAMIGKYHFVHSQLFQEERSREIYVAILKSMLSGSNEYCRSIMEENAFFAIPEFSNTGNEVFVDAGAYVGDTLEQFIWKNIGSFKKIYAFEPGERQYNAMQRRIQRLIQEWDIEPQKFVCVQAGLGQKDSVIPFRYNTNAPLSSNFISANDSEAKLVQVHSLDSFMGDETVTMIKADIEGFELEMLKGAKTLIKRCQPKLAISIYHKPEDFFEIPMFIHSLVPDYKMAIRHHAPNLVDTVLYCWI